MYYGIIYEANNTISPLFEKYYVLLILNPTFPPIFYNKWQRCLYIHINIILCLNYYQSTNLIPFESLVSPSPKFWMLTWYVTSGNMSEWVYLSHYSMITTVSDLAYWMHIEGCELINKSHQDNSLLLVYLKTNH